MDAYARIAVAAAEVIDLDHQIAILEAAKAEQKEIIAKGMTELGLEEGVFEGIKISYKTIDSSRFDTKQFASDYSDLYTKYVKPQSYKRMTVK